MEASIGVSGAMGCHRVIPDTTDLDGLAFCEWIESRLVEVDVIAASSLAMHCTLPSGEMSVHGGSTITHSRSADPSMLTRHLETARATPNFVDEMHGR